MRRPAVGDRGADQQKDKGLCRAQKQNFSHTHPQGWVDSIEILTGPGRGLSLKGPGEG